MAKFDQLAESLSNKVLLWQPKLLALPKHVISNNFNSQHRNIKMIVGHMLDSVSNNTHRIIHLQYQNSPVSFPDYANLGNNDKWITIQNYRDEDWKNLVEAWKYGHLHICHVIKNIDPSKLGAIWQSALNEKITLEMMVIDFPRHFDLHIQEIENLTNQ